MLIYITLLETEDERNRFINAYEKYKPYVIRYALSILQNDNQAEDAVHEAFVALILNKDKYLSKMCPEMHPLIVYITDQ